MARDDGSLIVAEMFGERVTRIAADGEVSMLAEVAGGPNGLAAGPDGCLILCNNGARLHAGRPSAASSCRGRSTRSATTVG